MSEHSSINELHRRIKTWTEQGDVLPRTDDIEQFASDFLGALEAGHIRAAERLPDGSWHVYEWVKHGILILFRYGHIIQMDYAGEPFFDKHFLPPQRLNLARRVRIVPGGSTIRRGAYIAPGVICMPPMYINIGAYVDEGTMVDSHALIGTCAQVGKRVHISASAQIGGVLEPAHSRPVIIEDDVFIGGNTGIYEGILIRRGAVIAAGVILTASIPVFDLVNEKTITANHSFLLEIPECAVVIPGTRMLRNTSFARNYGLSASCALIVKYRDSRTDARTALEQSLRL